MHTEITSEDYALCSTQLRQQNYDLWFSCLLLPERYRAALCALYCFSTEIATMRSRVSEPFLGEIRLQWWREVLDGSRLEEGGQHPQARALECAIAHYNLPRSALLAMVDAHINDMYDDPVEQQVDLEVYWGETVGARIRLACLILADGQDPGGADACGHAGVALGAAAFLKRFSRGGDAGRFMMPIETMVRYGVGREQLETLEDGAILKPLWHHFTAMMIDHLDHAESHFAQMPRSFIPLFAELGLIRTLSGKIRHADFNIGRAKLEQARFLRQWCMWRYKGKS